jgi:hypothetical protein
LGDLNRPSGKAWNDPIKIRLDFIPKLMYGYLDDYQTYGTNGGHMRTMKKVKKVVLRGRLSLDRNRLNGDPKPNFSGWKRLIQ